MARFETTQLAYEAAASGLGLTLAVPLLSDRFIADKRLHARLGPAVPIGYDYSVFYATADIERRTPVRTFVRWLHAEIAISQSRFDQWIDRSGVPTSIAA